MGILNYVPTFKVVEPNRLTGLITGQVLSQFRAASTIATKDSAGDFIENGIILGLNDDLTLGNYDSATHKQPFLHFTEELVTFLSGNNKFAVEVDEDGEAYPRAIGLYVGDSFTTDNFVYEEEGENAGTARVVDGVITIEQTTDTAGNEEIFAVEMSTLPTGEDAVRVTYLGA